MPHIGEKIDWCSASLDTLLVTPTGSPYTEVAPSNGIYIITGGTVTTIEYGRNGVFTVVGLLAGVIPFTKGDSLRITYAVAPTVNFVPFA